MATCWLLQSIEMICSHVIQDVSGQLAGRPGFTFYVGSAYTNTVHTDTLDQFTNQSKISMGAGGGRRPFEVGVKFLSLGVEGNNRCRWSQVWLHLEMDGGLGCVGTRQRFELGGACGGMAAF